MHYTVIEFYIQCQAFFNDLLEARKLSGFVADNLSGL